MKKMILVAMLLLCAVMACGCMGNGNEIGKSVTIGDYTFEGNFDDKWSTDSGDLTTYKPADMEGNYGIPRGAYDWSGLADYAAFYYKSGEEYPITQTGWASIFILKPDEDMADKESADILRAATYLIIDPHDHRNAVITDDLTEKEVEYNGKQAYLIEIKEELMDGFINYRDYAAIAFFVDDDTVALIGTETSDNFGVSAWDIIDSITVY